MSILQKTALVTTIFGAASTIGCDAHDYSDSSEYLSDESGDDLQAYEIGLPIVSPGGSPEMGCGQALPICEQQAAVAIAEACEDVPVSQCSETVCDALETHAVVEEMSTCLPVSCGLQGDYECFLGCTAPLAECVTTESCKDVGFCFTTYADCILTNC